MSFKNYIDKMLSYEILSFIEWGYTKINKYGKRQKKSKDK